MEKILLRKAKQSFIISIFLFLFFPNSIFAQENTLYFLDGAPDKIYLNPAKQPECNIFLSMPGATSSYSYYNSAITVQDVIFKSPSGDSIIHPLHPEADLNEFLDLFQKSNILSFDTKHYLGSIGFRVNRMFFNFNMALNQNFRLTYPDDFMRLVLTGNEDGGEYDFTSFGINSKSYLEIGFGVSRKLMENLTVGIRPKLYAGIYAVQSDFHDITLSTSLEEWSLTAQGEVNAAIPLVDPPVDAEGKLNLDDSTYSDYIEDEIDKVANNPSSITSMLFANKGLGIDIGVEYKPFSFLEISASIVDLGKINWKNHTHNLTLDGQYGFNGIDYEDFNGDENDSVLTDLVDSIKNDFQVGESSEAFSTGLDPTMYLAGRYFVSDNFDIGVLSRTKFYKSHVRQDLTISTNFRPGRALNLSLSYSLLDASYSNFGIGLSARIFGAHWFFVVDDISLNRYEIAIEDAPFNPSISRDLNSYNIRFGMSMMFGCNKKKKLRKDTPLLYSEDAFIY